MITYIQKNYILPVCKYRGKFENIKFPCYVSLKLDGELQYVIKKGEKIFSVNKSKYGRYRYDYPALHEFSKLRIGDGIFLAELYWNEGRTKEDFYGLLRNKASDNLKLALWGVLQYNKEFPSTERTYEILSDIKRQIKKLNCKYLSVIPFWFVKNKEELDQLINKYIIQENYEGLVIRNTKAVWIEGSHIDFIKIKRKDREINYKNAKYGIWL